MNSAILYLKIFNQDVILEICNKGYYKGYYNEILITFYPGSVDITLGNDVVFSYKTNPVPSKKELEIKIQELIIEALDEIKMIYEKNINTIKEYEKLKLLKEII